MNNINKYFAVIIFALVAVGFFYSCSKDSDHNNSQSKDVATETRAVDNHCTPQKLLPLGTPCFDMPRSILLIFPSSHALYSNGSTLYSLCPGLSFNVTYIYTTCNTGLPNETNYIHNIEYNIADIIAACPALQTAINNQIALGNLSGFLDLLDFDISKQIEFTEAYLAAIEFPLRYLCDERLEFYNIKVIESRCFTWVLYIDGPKDQPIPAYKKVSCNGNICCIRIGQYCIREFDNGEPVLDGSGNSTFEKTEGFCPVNCTHECGDPDLI